MSRAAVRLEKLGRALLAPRRRTQVRRLLVAHNLLLGDTLLLAPLMKALALAHPAAERRVLVRPQALSLFSGRPYGFEAMAFDRRNSASQTAVLHSGPYDLALVPDDNRYAWLARGAGAHWVVAFGGDRPAWKNWMVDEPVSYANEPHAWADMAVAMAGAVAPAPFERGEWPAPVEDRIPQLPARYAILHVGASTPLKHWPSSRWRLLADLLRERGLDIVWSAGRGEEQLVAAAAPRADEINLAGALELAQLWHVIARADLLVLPDTGVAHLARLIGTPTVALFGPGSVVVHGAGSFFAKVPYRAVTVDDFACRDQRVLYRRQIDWVRRCGRGFGSGPGQCPHGRCMDEIGFEPVRDAALELLGVSGA